MSLLNSLNKGETSCAILWSSSSVSAAFKLKKILVIRSNFFPEKSRATIVLSKVALSEFSAMILISSLAISIPFLMAGSKSVLEILEKGGVLKSCKSGFMFSMNCCKN